MPVATSQGHAVKVATSLLEAINGDDAAKKAWVEANISSPARQQNRAELWLEDFARISSTYGKLSFVSATRTPGNIIYVQVKRPGSSRSGNIGLAMSTSEPEKVGGIYIRPSPTAFDLTTLPSSLSQTAALKAVKDRVAMAKRNDDFSGVVLISKNDAPIYREAVGFADQQGRKRNTFDTRFNLASTDKMFTAIAIGQLIEAGKLSFDTKLIEVLPDYPNREAAEKINIRHLLSHSAGLGTLFDRPGYDGAKPFSRVSELFYAFAAEPLSYEPGASASYSNEGFVVLGAVVEKLSGRSWFDYVKANVLDKAGMKDTGHPLRDQPWPRKAVGYKFDQSDFLGMLARKPNDDIHGYRANSSGGGYSTAQDMTRFLAALKAGKLVSKDMVEQLMTPEKGGWGNYAKGFQVMKVGDDWLRGHDGGGPHSGINSYAKMLWNSGYTVAVMGNYDAAFAQTLAGDLAQILSRVELTR